MVGYSVWFEWGHTNSFCSLADKRVQIDGSDGQNTNDNIKFHETYLKI